MFDRIKRAARYVRDQAEMAELEREVMSPEAQAERKVASIARRASSYEIERLERLNEWRKEEIERLQVRTLVLENCLRMRTDEITRIKAFVGMGRWVKASEMKPEQVACGAAFKYPNGEIGVFSDSADEAERELRLRDDWFIPD